MIVVNSAARPGFRRAGREHQPGRTEYPDGAFTDEQIQQLKADPAFTVEILEGVKAPPEKKKGG